MRRPDLRALVNVELLSSLLQQLHFFQNTSPGGVANQPFLLFSILRLFFPLSPWVPNGGIDVLGSMLGLGLPGFDCIARVCVWLIVSLLRAGL